MNEESKEVWHDHVQRKNKDRLARIWKNERPTCKRLQGRPPNKSLS